MTLHDYMLAAGLKDHELACQLGVDRSTVTRLRQRATNPSFGVALRIIEMSGDRVTAADLAPLKRDMRHAAHFDAA